MPKGIVGGFALTEFFQEIEKNGTIGHERVFASAKESNKIRFDSYSVRNSVLIIYPILPFGIAAYLFSDNHSLHSCIQMGD